VYVAEQEIDGVQQVYSVPIAGGKVVRLNAPLAAGSSLGGVEISADSSRVVYTASPHEDEFPQLYSVPITGGTPVRLNGPLVSNGALAYFAISPDSARVIYLAEQERDTLIELFATFDDALPRPGSTAFVPIVSR